MQMMGAQGGPTQNVNEQLIRPLFLNASVILLFVLPMITMRTYSEEKRSGHDRAAAHLAADGSPDHHGQVPRRHGALRGDARGHGGPHAPSCSRSATPNGCRSSPSYLGLLLMGGCFIAVGLLDLQPDARTRSSPAWSPSPSFLLLWVINWIGSFTGPTTQAVLDYLSITDHLDDFTRGILDTKHLVYYVSFIAFGLFLTARSVDSERWRG